MRAMYSKNVPEKLIVQVFNPILSSEKTLVYQIFNSDANVRSHCFDVSPSFISLGVY